MVRRTRRNSALRDALIASKSTFLQRWPTETGRIRLAALQAGEPVLVSSTEVFQALFRAGDPEFARYARLDRSFVLTASNDLCDEAEAGTGRQFPSG
jgi:hypothetical protein